MIEPTDAEILDAADDFRSQYMHGGITFDEFDAIGFARAVLAKWGTPPAVAGEPVAWLSTDCIGERYLCFTKPKDSDHVRPLAFGDVQAGAVPLTDEMASKAGRALSDLCATECGIDKEDNWKVYGSDFIETAKLVLAAAHGIKGGRDGNV